MSESKAGAATFEVDGTSLTFDRIPAVEGNDAVDISALLKSTGLVTLDTGFVNTASTQSSITYIDGDEGILRYRGYPIEQLAEASTFLEVAYLLIYGELPDAQRLTDFTAAIDRHRELDEGVKQLLATAPAGAHPMAVLQAAISALAAFHLDTLDPRDAEQRGQASIILLAKVPAIVAAVARHAAGEPVLDPDPSSDYVVDFLRMTFGQDDVDPDVVKAMDMLLILHADHEQNCSTSTVRMVGSAHASIYASVSAGVGALSGPLHGGANEAVLEMLADIQSSGGDASDFMTKVKNKEDGVRLMGFGHRVYKNYDPRAAIVKKAAHDVLDKLGKQDEMLDIAMGLEEIALQDEYFISRKLYPNVDFYTGLIYKAMGFPTTMFTPLFSLGRLPGWIAQFAEMITDPATKIGRPRQVYTGATERDYVAVAER
ncbi:citrate synthase [Bogoriella caseilytica]|uniref:Citrate synthase n=1 Tax=Bogoriella caseilytica TaxID=56055 RepID=A0A3N2BA38_9MICO|nr:citrate synthase [Bogoriella caseilytica]ROR72140.1 citrate synthase [Bogoriella caseilytica]